MKSSEVESVNTIASELFQYDQSKLKKDNCTVVLTYCL